MRETKDYLHLYLGCEVLVKDSVITGTGDTGIIDNNLFGRLTTTSILGNIKQKFRVLIGAMSVERSFNLDTDKPILRPLSDMTEEEAFELFRIEGFEYPVRRRSFKILDNRIVQIKYWLHSDYAHDTVDIKRASPDQFAYLLSRSFDLFNLIPDGLAIDKPALTPKL